MPREAVNPRFQGQVPQGKLFYCETAIAVDTDLLVVPRKAVYGISYVNIYSDEAADRTVILAVKSAASVTAKLMSVVIPGPGGSAQFIDHGQVLYLGPGSTLVLDIQGGAGADLDIVISGQIFWLPS